MMERSEKKEKDESASWVEDEWNKLQKDLEESSKPYSVIKCPACGNSIRNDQKYCPSCGLSIRLARAARKQIKLIPSTSHRRLPTSYQKFQSGAGKASREDPDKSREKKKRDALKKVAWGLFFYGISVITGIIGLPGCSILCIIAGTLPTLHGLAILLSLVARKGGAQELQD